MNRTKFSIVIPLIPAHHKYVYSLLTILSQSTSRIHEVIFAASSQNKVTNDELKKICEGFTSHFKIEFIASELKFTAGQNRNRGWDIATGDYIAFCDADDSYHPDRLRIVATYIEKYKPDLILHDYTKYRPYMLIKRNKLVSKIDPIEGDELYFNTFPYGHRNFQQEGGSFGESNLILPVKLRPFSRIHHGHPIVKKSLSIRFGDKIKGEDGIFARDVLEFNKNVIYIPLKLSNYNRPYFSNLKYAIVSCSIFKLSQLKKRFLANISAIT